MDWQEQLNKQMKEHGRLYYRLAFNILRDAHSAEDICQSALLKAWQEKDNIKNHKALRGWLARVVVNESLNANRRKKPSNLDPHLMQAQSDFYDSHSYAFELREVLVNALEKLPEKMRMVVVLRIMEGMPGREVSALLGISAGEVSRQLYQGLELLRAVMEKSTVRSPGEPA